MKSVQSKAFAEVDNPCQSNPNEKIMSFIDYTQ